MTKTELARSVAKKAGVTPKDIKLVLDTISEVVLEELRGGGDRTKVVVGDFVVLYKIRTKATKARPGRNPLTGETITIAAKKAGWRVKARIPKNVADFVKSGK